MFNSKMYLVVLLVLLSSLCFADLIPPTFEITHTENGDVTILVTSDEDLHSGWVDEKLIWSVGNFYNWSLNTRLEKDPQNNLYAAVQLTEQNNTNYNFDMFKLENNGEIAETNLNWNGPGGNPLIINNPDENIYLGQPTIEVEGAVDNNNITYTFSTWNSDRWSTIYFSKIDADGNVLITNEPIITGIDAWAFGIRPAIDSNNRIYIVWSNGMHDITYAYSDDEGDSWSAPASLAYNADEQMNKPDICCDSNGNVHIVWQRYSYFNLLAYMKLRPDGSVAIAESHLTQNNTSVWCPRIDVDEQDNLHITWAKSGQNQGRAQYTKINGNLDANGASLTDDELTLIQEEVFEPATNVRYPKCIVDGYENVHTIYEQGDYGLNTPKSFYYRKRNSSPLLRIECPDDSILFVEMTGGGTGWEGTFTPPENGEYNVRVSASDVDGNTGVDNYQFEYPGTRINDQELLLADIQLSNFPNPFNPTTTISFSVPQNSNFVSLEIFNLKGQKIKTFPVTLSGDEGSIIWDGTDQTGKPVSSGIYFYKLVSEGINIASKKMLLLK